MIAPLLMASMTALVLQDDTALRAAPKESAARQAVLYQGDALEVRGDRVGYLQVYDHRRERGGYVKLTSVRTYSDDPADAPALNAVLQFLKDAPGMEALGIAHVALFLGVAPPAAITADVFDALGVMADRLARRASARSTRPDDPVAAHLDVAAGYGVHFGSFDLGGRTRVCYDGEAFRRVLALNGTEEQKARAALGLTRLECVDPAMTASQRRALDEWRAEILDRVSPSKVAPFLAGPLLIRQAATWAALAHERRRLGETERAQAAAERSLAALAGVVRADLSEDDASAYQEAAVRVGASRWAAETETATSTGLRIVTLPGADPGQTCVRLVDDQHDGEEALLERCTFGVVWNASARASPKGNALALAVQPTEAWRELWVFHRAAEGWTVDVLAPGTSDPDVGYLEYAGWTPDGKRLLTVREARAQTSFQRSFEILNVATLEVEKHADQPGSINTFHRWQAPDWKARTVAIR